MTVFVRLPRARMLPIGVDLLRDTIYDGGRLGAAGDCPNNSRIACICFIPSIVPGAAEARLPPVRTPTALSVRSTAAFHPKGPGSTGYQASNSIHYAYPANATAASGSTRAPRASCSGVEY